MHSFFITSLSLTQLHDNDYKYIQRTHAAFVLLNHHPHHYKNNLCALSACNIKLHNRMETQAQLIASACQTYRRPRIVQHGKRTAAAGLYTRKSHARSHPHTHTYSQWKKRAWTNSRRISINARERRGCTGRRWGASERRGCNASNSRNRRNSARSCRALVIREHARTGIRYIYDDVDAIN